MDKQLHKDLYQLIFDMLLLYNQYPDLMMVEHYSVNKGYKEADIRQLIDEAKIEIMELALDGAIAHWPLFGV